MTENRHELAVIGAGPAGIAASAEALRLEVRSLLLVDETGSAGGTIRIAHEARNIPFLDDNVPGHLVAEHLAVFARRLGLDICRARITRLSDSQDGVDIWAADGRRWQAERVIVATGTRAAHPAIAGLPAGGEPPWADSAWEAVRIKSPQSVLLIGASDVAFDQARWLVTRGVPATVLCRSEKPRAPQWLVEAAVREGVTLHCSCHVLSGEVSSRGVTLKVQSEGAVGEIPGDRVVAAVGRVPCRIEGMQDVREDRLRVAGDATGRAARHVAVALGDGCLAAATLLARDAGEDIP